MHRLRRSCARWPAATWAYARSTASATSAPRPCRSWAASRPRPEPATPATPRCIPPRPAPPLRALHARRQRPRARQGPRPGCRRADPGPGGRGRARRQATGARAGGRRLGPAATAVANAWRASTRWTRRGDWTTRAPSPPPAPTPCCCPRSKARPSWALARALTRPARPPTFPCGPCAKRRWAFCVWTPSPAIPGWRPWSWARRTWSGSACAPHAGPRGNAAGAFAGRHGRPRPRTGGVGWRAPGPGR